MRGLSDSVAAVTEWLRAQPESRQRLVPVIVGAGLLLSIGLMWRRTHADAVLPLPTDVVPAAAVAHLHERGLPEAVLNAAGRVVIPEARVVEARRWIDELQASTATWADEWEKSNAQLGQFSGSRERDAAREITRARMIGRLLRQMPGVAQADVIWDEEESSGWRRPQRTRCTVYLRPKTGFEITPDVAQSVRQAVAGSKKNLATSDIVVMDLARMTTFDAVPEGVDDAQRSEVERQVASLRREIENELRACEGVRVNVGVAWPAADPLRPAVPLTTKWNVDSRRTVAFGGAAETRFISQDIATDPVECDPRLQITVTVPEDSASRWAQSTADAPSAAADASLAAPTARAANSRHQKVPLAAAAASIRRSVASVVDRYRRDHLSAAVAVHLIPIPTPDRAALPELSGASHIDPAWFAAVAAGCCLFGAWLLSSLFRSAGPIDQNWNETLTVDGLSERLAADPSDPGRSLAGGNQLRDFEDLIYCPPQVWELLWRENPLDCWVAAMKGASQQLRRAVLSCLHPAEERRLLQALEQASPPRLSEIDGSQQQILVAAQSVLARGNR